MPWRHFAARYSILSLAPVPTMSSDKPTSLLDGQPYGKFNKGTVHFYCNSALIFQQLMLAGS